MQPTLAQVLNTLAHEIRTPLAVSQGYLKLYLDGRLTNADDQRRAFQQTREALGTLAVLCADMGKVSALAEAPPPALAERVPAAQVIDRVRDAEELAGVAWEGTAPAVSLVTHAAADLARAVATVVKTALDDAREQPRVARVTHADTLDVLAGTPDAIAALAAGPGASGAGPVDFGRGGRGLRLIWAAFVLQQHHVHTWTHQEHRAAVGFRFPLVQP